VNRLIEGIKSRPVISFFIITFLISWGMFILALKIFPGDDLLQAPFVNIGAFAPALVSIALAKALDPGKRSGKSGRRPVAFFVSWLVAFINLLFFASLMNGLPVNPALVAVGAFLALLPAFVISSIFSKTKSVRDHISTLIKPRGNPVWYALALVGVPAVLFLGMTVTRAVGKTVPEAGYTLKGEGLLLGIAMITLVLLTHLINSGGVAEEPGWRGFALKYMQKKYSPLAAGVVIGFLWGLWHVPVMLNQAKEFGPAMVVLQVVTIGIVFTWFYNRTQGSLLAVVLLHASWNAGVSFLPRTEAFHLMMAGIVAVMILSDRMWRKIPVQDPA
jgi:membrane protease YdiL (CAAX protease family)